MITLPIWVLCLLCSGCFVLGLLIMALFVAQGDDR